MTDECDERARDTRDSHEWHEDKGSSFILDTGDSGAVEKAPRQYVAAVNDAVCRIETHMVIGRDDSKPTSSTTPQPPI